MKNFGNLFCVYFAFFQELKMQNKLMFKTCEHAVNKRSIKNKETKEIVENAY